MDDQQLLRYSRHLLLDDIGIEGQEKLLNAHAVVLGAGGLGSPVALYLGSAGLGTITIIDDDIVELSNLQRQIMHTEARVGQPKAASAREAVAALNPGVEVRAIARRATEELLHELAADADVVLDCSDNFATRHMLNRVCVALRKPLISGAAIGFAGQITVYDLRRDDSPCYACVFPPSQPAPDARCATTGVLAPLVGMTGSLQAAEAIKLLCGYGTPLTGRLLMADLRRTEFTQVHLHRRADCEVCGAPLPSPPPAHTEEQP